MNGMHCTATWRWRRAGAALLPIATAAVVLAGCGSSPSTRYFTLQDATPPPAAATGPYSGAPLRVRSVQLPPALDRPEMLREVAPGQVEILEFDHWAAPLPRLARQALAEALAARLPKDKVVFPGASWPEGGADLAVDILSFRVTDGVAVMQLSWTLRGPPPLSSALAAPASSAASATSAASAAATPAAAPAVRGAHLRLQAPASADAAGTARAFSDLIGQLADQIVASLRAAPT